MEKKSRENYTRVTHVLYPFSGMDKINPEILAHAGDRGTRVHKTCESIMQGFGEMGVDTETAPYVESFKQWWSSFPSMKAIEKRFWDDDLELTGQCDMIMEMEDGLAIVDIKTSYKPSKTWSIQGNAYAYLAKKAGYDIKKIYFLHLSKMGKEAKIYEYPIDETLFLAVYRVWKYFYG